LAFSLSVVTPEGSMLETEVDSVVAPGSHGEFGVLSGHEAFLAPLSPGLLRCEAPGGGDRIVVTEGFAEVTGEHMTVLVNAAERPADIDVERAQQAKERALARIERRIVEDELDEQRAQTALARAQARLESALVH
jgi:F-type H+-transporting ATPase subunit epsilon